MQSTTLKGKIFYTGWKNRPWKLVQEDGSEIDLFPVVEAAFLALHGKRASHEEGLDSYSLLVDPDSKFEFDYSPDKFVLLQNKAGVGFSNVHAYFCETLQRLNGRLIDVTTNDAGLTVTADPSDKVFGVKWYGSGNSCRIPEGAEDTVCKMGTSDCCIFLALGPDGPSCEKFAGSSARMVLQRYAEGTMKASRIGNCALLGREEKVPALVE